MGMSSCPPYPGVGEVALCYVALVPHVHVHVHVHHVHVHHVHVHHVHVHQFHVHHIHVHHVHLISTMSVSSPDDKLSENIWFVWSKTSYDRDKWRCYHGDKRRTNNKVKIELVNKSTIPR